MRNKERRINFGQRLTRRELMVGAIGAVLGANTVIVSDVSGTSDRLGETITETGDKVRRRVGQTIVDFGKDIQPPKSE